MANIIASGDWWRLEDDGTLYVYCTGGMPDYGNNAPWHNYRLQITSAVISSSVTSIGYCAFLNCANLASVTIPNSVAILGDYAFQNCAMKSLEIPNSVVSIGIYAISKCTKLESVTLPNSITGINNGIFWKCSGLTSVTIPNSVASIGRNAFLDCPLLADVYYNGTEAQWNTITIDSGNDSLENATIHYTEAPTLASIAVTTPPTKTAYTEGEAFDAAGMVVSATYSDTSTAIVTGYSVSPSGSLTTSDSAVTVIYTENGIAKTATVAITVTAVLTSIAVTTPPAKTAYAEGEAFDPSEMVVTATYSDATTATVTGYSISPATELTVSDTVITISYTEDNVTKTATVEIIVSAPQPQPEPNRIQIHVMKHNGETLTFSEGAVKSLEYVQSTSFDGNDMQSDEMSAVIRQTSPDWLSNWKGANGVNRACPVVLTLNSRNGALLRTEKYCFKELRRVEKYDFQMTAQSPLGRLTDDFPGGLYSAAPLSTVIAAVIGNAIPRNAYSINPKLSKVRVYGWIPYQERRTTLHQLSLAYGFIIRRDANNNLYFTVPDTDNPYTIPANAIFTGGSVDYSVGRTYARADITAYDYSPIETEAKVLFDNTSGAPADKFIVRFDSPMFDLWTDTLRVSGYGMNYAEVSGYGRLTGKPYTQIASVISVNGDADADPQNILSVSNIPMITSLNAVSVGERLLNYNNAPAVVNMDILRTNQRPGDYVSFTDPFGDPQTSGYITAMSGSITSIDRASVSVVCGYVPVWGSSYDSVIVLTKETALEDDNTWTVPDYLNRKKIRIVLIGGGTGGASGQHGTDSNGKGGIGGFPGAGGKIYDTTLLVSGGNIFRYQCGTGGAGGVASDVTTNNLDDSTRVYESNGVYHLKAHGDGTFYATTLKAARDNGSTPCSECFKSGDRYYVNNNGSDGTASTFVNQASDVNLSSNGGSSSDIGFYDIIENKMYAAPGAYNGVDGGSATTGTERTQAEDKTRTQQHIGPEWLSVTLYPVSLPWDTSQEWFSGNPGTGDSHYEGGGGEYTYEWAYGGLGGGAAVGYNGNNGGNARGHYAGGNGGNGANADTIFPNIIYGGGGNGGHGGGEGGIGGKGYSVGDDPQAASDGASGSGGNGSNGQDGADGCILIYYKSPDA